MTQMTPLRQYWHPVATSAELAAAPIPVTLLEEGLVLFRDGDGSAVCLTDLCAHRGVALSLGRVVGGQLECPYHGWTYDNDGRCTRIPQLRPSEPISARARVGRYPCVERLGLIWVLLDGDAPPPEPPPEFASADYALVTCNPYTWQTSAARMMENFTDFGHFAFVHAGILGTPENPEIAPYDVTETGDALSYSMTLRMPARTQQELIDAGMANLTDPAEPPPTSGLQQTEFTFDYRLTVPHQILVRRRSADGLARVTFFAASPVSATASRGFPVLLVPRTVREAVTAGVADTAQQAALWQSHLANLVRLQDIIAEQDKRVVESQRPGQLPADLSAELHFRFDRLAVRYRRALQARGIDVSISTAADLTVSARASGAPKGASLGRRSPAP